MAQISQEKEKSDLNYVNAEIGSNNDNKRSELIFLAVYLLALIIAEYSALHNLQLGLLIEALILFALLVHSSVTTSKPLFMLLRSMMALPIIRILGLSISIIQIPQLYWFILVAIPLIIISYTIIKAQGLTLQDVGLIGGNIPLQVLIASTGIILGVVEFIILHPQPLIPTINAETVILGSIILIISTGFAEELLFRGIIQTRAQNALGIGVGLLYAALLFTVMDIGWNSPTDLIFVFLVGLFYGYSFYKTKSILGVIFSHGISNILIFLILPFYATFLL